MAHLPISFIKPLGVDPIEIGHSCREIRQGSFYDKMIMIGHEAVGMTEPSEPFSSSGIDFEKERSVIIREKNILSPVTSGCSMIQSTWKFDPQWSGHG